MNPVNRDTPLRRFFHALRSKFVSIICTDVGFSIAIYVFAMWAYGIQRGFFGEENDSEYETSSNTSGSNGGDVTYALFDLTSVFLVSSVFFFTALFVFGKLIQFILFKTITRLEWKNISHMLLRFIVFRLIILSGAIITDSLAGTFIWLVWFGFLGFLHSILIVASSRCATLSTLPFVQKLNWIRMGLASLFLLFSNWYLLKYGLQFCIVWTGAPNSGDVEWKSPDGRDISPMFLLGNTLGIIKTNLFPENEYLYKMFNVIALQLAECILLYSSILYLIGTLIIQFYDRWLFEHDRSWNYQSTYSYYLEFFHSMFCRLLETAHYFHLLLWSRMFSVSSLLVFLYLRSSFSHLLTRVRRHVLYRRFNKHIADNYPLKHGKTSNSFPVSNCDTSTGSEEKDASCIIEPEAEVCAICWETMTSWRCLPCRHDFHDTCLRSWLLQNPSCPTCRRDLGIPPILLRANTFRHAQMEHPIFGVIPQNVHHMNQPNTVPVHRPPEGPSVTSTDPVGTHNGSVLTTTRVGLNFGMDIGGSTMVTATAHAITRGTNGTPVDSRFLRPGSSQATVSTNSTVLGDNLASSSATTAPTDINDGSQAQRRTFHFDGSRYFSWLPSFHFEWFGSTTQVLRIPSEPTNMHSVGEHSAAGNQYSSSVPARSTTRLDRTTTEQTDTSEDDSQLIDPCRVSISGTFDVTMPESVEIRHEDVSA